MSVNEPTRTTRVWVYALLALLCIPGIVGFDIWPLTGWRLFSLSRRATQAEWVIDADTPAGIVHVDPDQLPLAFRNVAWPLAGMATATQERRQEVCLALRDPVRDVVPDATRLIIVLEGQELRGTGVAVTMQARFHACSMQP